MEIKKVGNFLNFVIFILGIITLFIPIAFVSMNLNLDNMTPNKFFSINIEGTPKVRPVIIQRAPILNTNSVKDWVKQSANYFMNYTSTDYLDRLYEGKNYMTPRFYSAFYKSQRENIEKNIKNGIQISSSIVIQDPVLLGKAIVNGIPYYKYYLRTSTTYKAETKTIQRNHDVIMVVKKENPAEVLRGVAIDDLQIK